MITSHQVQTFGRFCKLLCVVLATSVITVFADQDRPLTNEEQIAYERYRSNEHALKGDSEVSNMIGVLSAYQVDNHGQSPSSWADLERQYGKNVWDSKKGWEKVKRMFVFVPQIEGEIPVSEAMQLRGKMLMVLTAPLDQKREMRGRVGRWVFWLFSDGHIGNSWFAEEDLQRFSAWPEVQKVIDSAKAELEAQAQTENQQPQANASDKLPINMYPKPCEPMKTVLPSEGHERGWLIWLFIVMAALSSGVWFMRKRAK